MLSVALARWLGETIQLEIYISDELEPVIDRLAGEFERADFLRRALELGLCEIMADAARISSDRALNTFRDHTAGWSGAKTLFSVHPPVKKPER